MFVMMAKKVMVKTEGMKMIEKMENIIESPRGNDLRLVDWI